MLPPALSFYIDAFWEVSTERQIGMGEGPIPRSAVTGFAVDAGIEGERRSRFRHLIRAMDATYMKHRADARARADDAGKQKADAAAEARRAAKEKLLASTARP